MAAQFCGQSCWGMLPVLHPPALPLPPCLLLLLLLLSQASESEARLRGMRLHDKALLAGSRLIAGSKLARAAVALYVLLLHGVIMALMYFSATPHTTLYATSDSSSSIPSAVARLGNSTAEAAAAAAAGVAGLQEAAAGGRAAAGAGARLLLRAFALPHL